jgi:DNA mismatch repair protein MutS2
MDGSGNVWVLSDGVRVSLPGKSLRVVVGEAPDEPAVTAPTMTRPESEDAVSEVDLRGLRVDECLEKLDRALDQALLCGLKELRVIHGKGTGALKEAVRSFCRSHSAVHGVRTAPDRQGGAGATLVELED